MRYNFNEKPPYAYLFNDITQYNTCSPGVGTHPQTATFIDGEWVYKGEDRDKYAYFVGSEYHNLVTNNRVLFDKLKECGKLRGNSFFEGEGNDGVESPIKPPTPPSGGEDVDKTCGNTGQFGGGGTPLKDIKLFLYANNVTKGTIKLSKPQVEVGTFATDWRPNPSDYVERNSPAYKEVKGLAIQHNQDQNKKYIEVQATDGTVYGVDIWGGDAQKLLEQQQAEIEELKKLVQTLETKINV